MISVDTLRADRLNSYGYTRRQTSAAIDALARDAVLFERHQTASPWTTPSHLSLLTSLSPTRHGVTDNLATLMTGLSAGKGYQRLPDATLTLAEALAAGGWTTAAFTGGVSMDPRLGFGQGFASYENNMGKVNQRNVGELLAWIEGHRDRPFFLFWHTFEVHAPYLRGTFLEEVLEPTEAERLRRDLETLARRPDQTAPQEAWTVLTEHGAGIAAVTGALYDGGVRWMDDALGRVVAALKAGGLYDRMLIVFTSDHGEELGDRRWPGKRYPQWGIYNTHGHTLYEEMTWVPLLIKLPASEASGRRIGSVTRAIDVMPTVLDILGVRVEAPLEGVSLRPLWTGNGKTGSRAALVEACARQAEKKAIRDDRYKYIVSMDADTVARYGRHYLPDPPGETELFDLLRDPGERHNLLVAPDTLVRGRAEVMDQALRRMLTTRGQAETLDPSQIDMEGLRALGYIE